MASVSSLLEKQNLQQFRLLLKMYKLNENDK